MTRPRRQSEYSDRLLSSAHVPKSHIAEAGLLVPLPAVSQFTLKGTGVTASDFTSPLSPQG